MLLRAEICDAWEVMPVRMTTDRPSAGGWWMEWDGFASGGGYLQGPRGRVHLRTATSSGRDQLASGKPAVLMMHQSPLSSRRYRRALPALAEFCVPIALDSPGYGESDRDAGDWTVDDYAQTPWQVAEMLGLERPWLFGRATGAVFALRAAALRPGSAAGIVLHGVPVYTATEKADRLASFAPPYAQDVEGGHLSWIWRRIHSEYPHLQAALLTELVQDYLSAGPDFGSAYRAIWRHDVVESSRLAGPVDLLMTGDADRLFYMHDRATQEIAHRSDVILAGADDFVAELEPRRFVDALRNVIVGPG